MTTAPAAAAGPAPEPTPAQGGEPTPPTCRAILARTPESPAAPTPGASGSPAPEAPARPAPEAPARPAPGAPDAPAPEAAASTAPRPELRPRLRLRPGVAVTPLLTGLHLRGRGTVVTLEGSRALPALWQLLSDRLAPDPAVRGDGGTETGTGAQAVGDAEAGAGARADGDTEAGTKAQTNGDTEAGTEAQTNGDTEAGTKAQTNGDTEASTKAQTNGDTEASTKAQTNGDTQAGSGAWADAGIRAGALIQADARADAAASDRADPRVEAALATLTARLREHDLLVEHPDGAELAPWPGSSAAHPAEAVEAIHTARPVVAAPDPEGPLAVSLVGALLRAGASPRVIADGRLPAGRAVVTAHAPSGAVALAVSCEADGGFVTEPGPPHRARSDAASLATRLGTGTGTSLWAPPPAPPPASAPAPGGPDTPSRAQVALLAGAAAGRLLAAVAGLPDPAAHEDASGTATAGHPAVLIARAEPPEATFHPWAAAPRAARREPDAPPAPDLAEALRRITALGDPRLGVLDAPLPGDLPQLPASLASCRTPAGLLVAGAVRADLARLEAACRAAELALADGPSAPVVGTSPGHAHGRALRRAVLDRIGPQAASAAPTAEAVAAGARADGTGADVRRTHPQARHWWTVLTERMGRSADLSVRQLCSGQAHAAVIRVRPASTGTAAAPVTVSRAVEATAADAVALAALDAVTRAMAAQHAPGLARHTALSGAAAPLAVAGAEPADWADEGWTDVWLAGIAAREPALRAALHRLTGLCPTPWRGTGHHPLADALRASGFTVLTGPGGPR
ncbi:hypothetical protein ACH41H_09505 [Streptomyces sp. NPDC020800]|uniref:hypothetical protein n=1 Tax=Streptomyces sp. NPDC020800 TaxID=3365092 RepID=UPI0037A104BD